MINTKHDLRRYITWLQATSKNPLCRTTTTASLGFFLLVWAYTGGVSEGVFWLAHGRDWVIEQFKLLLKWVSPPLPTCHLLGLGLLVTTLPPIWLKRVASFFACISWELAVHTSVDEFMADAMGVALDDGVPISIIPFNENVLLGDSFGFRRCGISTIFLTLNFCAVYFPIV